MKTSMKILSVVLCLMVVGFEGWAQEKDWVGTWQYTAPQADYQYQKGQIVFVMEGKELKAFIEVNQNKIPGQQLQVSKDEASFSIILEGEPIQISLKKENKKLSGQATYSEGKVSITAEKTA
jgi:hypothetical protein